MQDGAAGEPGGADVLEAQGVRAGRQRRRRRGSDHGGASGENLRIAGSDASPDDLRAALRSARLLEWVDFLPDGLDTLVGEHGLALSGGQRRRLALARALLADTPVLILDEPTEHLDDETAAALTRDLLAAAGGRTVLLITHRTDDLAVADEVVTSGMTVSATPA